MKDTKEKARFFAQYWGQSVLMDNHKRTSLGDCHEILAESLIQVFDTDYLLLKNLYNITDKDAVEAIMISLGESKEKFKVDTKEAIEYYRYSAIEIGFTSNEADFLRSNGYLVPFNGKSPEEIIKKGWAKYESN